MKNRLFDGFIITWLRKHRLVRRVAFFGGLIVGGYFLGKWQGWW